VYYPSASQLIASSNPLSSDDLQLSSGDFMQLSSVTLNSDITASFTGVFVFGNMSPNQGGGIRVSGTIGTFQRGGPLGYEANFSFHGMASTGETIEYQALLFINSQHATTSGTLFDCCHSWQGVTGTFF
jgi:hypothetical protein